MRFLCFVQLLGQRGKTDGEGTQNGGDKPRGTGKGDGTLQGGQPEAACGTVPHRKHAVSFLGKREIRFKKREIILSGHNTLWRGGFREEALRLADGCGMEYRQEDGV